MHNNTLKKRKYSFDYEKLNRNHKQFQSRWLVIILIIIVAIVCLYPGKKRGDDLCISAANHDLAQVKILVPAETGADTGSCTSYGTALMSAAQSGDINIVEYLLTNHASAILSDRYNNSVLIYNSFRPEYPLYTNTTYIERDKINIASILIANGADISVENNKGQTAIQIANQSGYPNLATYLQTRNNSMIKILKK